MNRRTTSHRLGLCLSSIGFALLTACGGGGEPVPATVNFPQAMPAPVPTVCGLDAMASATAGSPLVDENRTIRLHDYEVPMVLLTAANGLQQAEPVRLSMELEDMRNVTFTGYTPAFSAGDMGVELSGSLPTGSVGCLMGVARVFNIGTEATPNLLVSWSSSEINSLPVGSLGSQAVNGFEFVHNLGPAQATAIFRVDKAVLDNASGVSICHIISESSVDCRAARISEDDLQWTFRRDISAPGVYMLAAPRAGLPLVF